MGIAKISSFDDVFDRYEPQRCPQMRDASPQLLEIAHCRNLRTALQSLDFLKRFEIKHNKIAASCHRYP